MREDPTSSEEPGTKIPPQRHAFWKVCTQWTFQPFSLRWVGAMGGQAIPIRNGRDQLHISPLWSRWTSQIHLARWNSSRANVKKTSPGGRKPVCNGRCAQTSRFGWGGYLAGRLTLAILHTLQVIHDLERRKQNDQEEAHISNRYRCERGRLHTCV